MVCYHNYLLCRLTMSSICSFDFESEPAAKATNTQSLSIVSQFPYYVYCLCELYLQQWDLRIINHLHRCIRLYTIQMLQYMVPTDKTEDELCYLCELRTLSWVGTKHAIIFSSNIYVAKWNVLLYVSFIKIISRQNNISDCLVHVEEMHSFLHSR